MANGSVEETLLWIGPPAPPPERGRVGRYCAEASLVPAVMGLVGHAGIGSHGNDYHVG